MDLRPCDGCDECGLRCTAGVQMSRAEYERVRAYVTEHAGHVEKVASQPKVVNLGDGVTVQACRFRDLERGRCAIYPVRPLVCRLLGHVEWLPCPIDKIRQVVPSDLAIPLMQAYADSERKTYEEWTASERRVS